MARVAAGSSYETTICTERVISRGSRPMSAQCASSTRPRAATNSTSLCGGPGMFQMSACSATSRSSRVPSRRSAGAARAAAPAWARSACPATGSNALEVEGFVLRPHPAQDLDRLAEPGDPSPGGTRRARTPRTRRWPDSRRRSRPCRAAGGAADTDAHDQPTAGDHVHGRGHLPEDGRRADAVAGDEEPEPQPLGLRGQGAEQRPTLMDLAVLGAAERSRWSQSQASSISGRASASCQTRRMSS